ncbi:MAG: response regulator [Myxococcota bacterium]|nr:response regulator [Myxococcota bacterium]
MPARILIADDYPDAREMLAVMVEDLGYESLCAENGREAVERAIAFRPDVMLMDIAMPELDGREATARIKADPRTRDAIVIAVTGQATGGQSAKQICPGCDMMLVKPVRAQTIEHALQTVLAGLRRPSAELRAPIVCHPMKSVHTPRA